MNDAQRTLAWIFAAAIFASILYAPWERAATIPDFGHVTFQSLHSEIWEPPVINSPNPNVGEIRLRTEVLIREWIAASLIYGSVFFALSDKKKKPAHGDIETANLESKGIQ